MWNQTSHAEFVITGFPELPQHQLMLFAIFITIYIFTLLENILLIVTICLSKHLHTPMYFFLGNLSILDIFYVSVTMPKLFSNLLLGEKTITLLGCLTQLYFFLSLASSECFLLATMAYDRYLAICQPLHYTSLMNHSVYTALTLASWLGGFIACFPSVVMISKLQFCKTNIIRHFFCDISPLLRLSCTDTSSIERLDFVVALAVLMTSLLVTGTSYGCILCMVASISSTKGKHKAFYTCASHLAVFSMFYVTTIFMYARPKAIGNFDLNKLVAILYAVVAPCLNPIIYSLRNREVREALHRAFHSSAAFLRCLEASRMNPWSN
ncbi:olfactory receptor 6-like [Varanus komodoensis]|uniref:olfactory receptor 6-like n=1 Tax=Varanus komodoensis TaxID=61221 RepID=UPI001CF7A39D|nr:olfactory receptor 6-like [Varanus komodoensis]